MNPSARGLVHTRGRDQDAERPIQAPEGVAGGQAQRDGDELDGFADRRLDPKELLIPRVTRRRQR